MGGASFTPAVRHRWSLTAVLAGLALLTASAAASAQPVTDESAAGAAASQVAAPAAQGQGNDAAPTADDAPDLDVLLAPVALFPDPLLAAVLQASVVPLDVVMAARFLDDYAKDPSREPDPTWDPAVRGLLAFPSVLKAMNQHLDWVQAVGDAVTGRLTDVQDSIQQDRAEFNASGILKSNDKQTVVVDGDVIRIMPTDPQKIFVPVYDPAALVEAIKASQAAQATTAAGTEAGPPPVPAEPAAETPAAPAATTPLATAEPPPAAPQQEAVATPPAPPSETAPPPEAAAPDAAPPAAAPEPAAPYAPAVPAAMPPPVVAPPVTYAAPVAYPPPASDGSSSAWTAVGSFAGGALVGGLLGYAISDDDDFDGWGDDFDEDDVEDAIDQIGDEREDAREDRQRFMDQAREDRQQDRAGARDQRSQAAAAAREDRQSARSDATSQRQSARLQREQTRQERARDAQAQLGQRAQRTRAPATTATARSKAPSPAAIRAAASPPSRQATPRLIQAGATRTARPAAPALPRQVGTAAPRRATATRHGDRQAVHHQASSLGGVQRGATVKRQELRGAKSRQAVTRPVTRPRAAVATTSRRQQPHAVHATHRAPTRAFAGAGGHGSRAASHERRGRSSRRR
jgi:hypothetical protein